MAGVPRKEVWICKRWYNEIEYLWCTNDMRECDGRKHTDIKDIINVPTHWTMEDGSYSGRRR
ncbi:hypothetical protein E3Q17_00275 [Wallemia mellicola]|uniref:Uncharacterized protein n=1 Tax=Wallemia mellicola TaxID=1708541 RepID=A0A4T0P5C4_9BASI|nr:hypothetical protein E3Q17_00275 [Wallemia mellicola]